VHVSAVAVAPSYTVAVIELPAGTDVLLIVEKEVREPAASTLYVIPGGLVARVVNAICNQ
jgi:hypothetical protein